MSKLLDHDGEISPYTEKKLANWDPPWPIEELVIAQRMECEGADHATIAAAIGRTEAEVAARLNPKPAPARPDRAGLGFAEHKRR